MQPDLATLTGDPHRAHAELRAAGPISRIGALGGWLVTSHELAARVLRSPDVFTVDDPRFSTAQVIGPSMLSLDGAEHSRHRAPFARGMGRSALRDLYEGRIDSKAAALVRNIAGRGTAELRAELASPLAVDSAAAVLGLDDSVHRELRTWYDAIVEAVDAISAGEEAPPSGRAAFESLSDAVIESGGPVLHDARGVLGVHEIASNAAVVLFGAIETGEGMIANVLWHALSHPAILRATAAGDVSVADLVEESIRLEPAAARVDRYATSDVTVGGADVAAGDLVVVSLAGANRDPAVFPDPDRFEPGRPNISEHLTFAVGPHACPGAHLARFEARAAMQAVIDELPGVVLDAGDSEAPSGLVFRKSRRVTARWDRRA